MKTKFTTLSIVLILTTPQSGVVVTNGHLSYLIGGIIALLIMGYLVYTLLRPEKF